MYKIPNISVPPMIPLQNLKDDVWTIVEVNGPHGNVQYNCDRRLVFGRTPKGCNIVFPADMPGISKLHCELVPAADGVQLRDLNSSYGTFLSNGKRVSAEKAVLLGHGDSFYLADREVVFRIQ